MEESGWEMNGLDTDRVVYEPWMDLQESVVDL